MADGNETGMPIRPHINIGVNDARSIGAYKVSDIIKEHIDGLKHERTGLIRQIELDEKWYKTNRDRLEALDKLIAKLEKPE